MSEFNFSSPKVADNKGAENNAAEFASLIPKPWQTGYHFAGAELAQALHAIAFRSVLKMNIDRPCPCRLLLIAVAVFSVAFAPHLRAVDRGFVKANVVEALAQEECCTYLAALPVNHGDFSRWERFTGVGLAVGIWVSFFASVFCGPSHLGATVGCSNGPSLVTQHIRLQN